MTKLDEFAQYLRDHDYARADLDRFREIIEPITETINGIATYGYRIKPLCAGDHVTQKCKVLVEYAWHCRDYIKKILTEHKVTGDIGVLINSHIQACPELQLVSYLANSYKHAGTDQSQKWATSIAPRFATPYVVGWLNSFPGRMKPFVRLEGDDLGGFEFTGSATDNSGVAHQFQDYTWVFSCEIEDHTGKVIGNAYDICEKTFEVWKTILKNHGITT